MIEAVAVVSQAALPVPDSPDVGSGGVETLSQPPAEVSAPEVARFDDVVRALRMDEVAAPAVPRARESWTRMGRNLNGGLDRLSEMEAKMRESTRSLLQPPNPVGLRVAGAQGASFGQYAPVSLGPTDANAPPMPEALAGMVAVQQSYLREILGHSLEMVDFSLSMSMATNTLGEFQKSIKQLAQGGGGG